MRIGILDILTLPTQNVIRRFYHLMITKQYASITPQAIAVWSRQLGHETFYAAYYGWGRPERALPDDLDILFIACFTQASPLAYALAKLYRRKGVMTVIGGAHAKSFPQDCIRFFDLVVKYCDKNLIADILKGHFKPGSFISSTQAFSDLPSVEERMPEIKASAFWCGKKPLLSTAIPMQASIGCPYSCNFCIDWSVPYQLYSTEHLATDLHYLAKNFPGTLIVFQDPNFGIGFDKIFDVFKSIPPGSRNPYLVQTSITALRQKDQIEQLKKTNCIFVGAGIESWTAYSNKTAAGHKTGREKMKQIVEDIHHFHESIPYIQTNFIFGLDTDEGDEPFELTKQFINQAPMAWPTVSIPFPFGGTPLFKEQLANNRILKNVPFGFYYNPYLVTTLKNYTPLEFYTKMADMLSYITSKTVFKKRLNSTSDWKGKSVHWVRTMGAKPRANEYRRIVERLRIDHVFRAFLEGESEIPPDFYHEEYEKMLGPYAKLLSVADRCPDLGQPEAIMAT